MNKNLFNSILVPKPNRNFFDLSHDLKMSGRMGYLYPTLVMDTVPGDYFSLGCDSLLRFAPLVAPVMHRYDFTMHYFFVPIRLLWDNWEKYITGTEGIVPPTLNLTQAKYNASKMWDYMGLPDPGTNTIKVDALPFAAMAMIYQEYYRDQNLIDDVNYKVVDGDNTATEAELTTMRRRAWAHDYFTSGLPFAQKGAPVQLPIGNIPAQPVYWNPITGQESQAGIQSVTTPSPAFQTVPDGNDVVVPFENIGVNPDIDPGLLYTEEMSVGATTINDLRRAERIQEWLERNARAGTRYTESIYGHFGVKSPDARLQRPEYITGVKSPVIISEVLNTTGAEGAPPQGNMAGHGVGVARGKYGGIFTPEHGFIIGVMSIRPITAYQQGIPRLYSRESPYDYFWPEFANIGEQEIKNKELYAPHATPEGVFAYNPRYSEYKYMPSRVAGEFKTTLNFWHHGRIFANDPELNQEFIECDPGNRVFAVTADVDNLYMQILHKIAAKRPMPKYGTPML